MGSKTCGQSQKNKRRRMASPIFWSRSCGGNRNELRTSHTRKGVEAGSNSPVDCCVSENRFPLHITASMAALCSPAKVLPSAKHL